MSSKKLFSLVSIGLLFCIVFTGSAFAKDPILIGSPLPLTGPYASDGEQMRMALELAVEERNAAGGVLGHPVKLKLGDVGGLEAEKIKGIGERLIGAGVNAVITGYDDGGVDTKVFGAFDIPYLHGNAMTLCTKPVAENMDKYWNVFQYMYNDVAYGVDAAKYLFETGKQMGWTAPNKKIAIIKVDYAYNIMPADKFADITEKDGYQVVVNETVPFGMADWGSILSKIESKEPAYVTFWHLDPTDAARFIKQFSEYFGDDGLNAQVYMQYTPSVPEFIQLAGKAAEGVIWVGGAYGFGQKYEDYKKRWVKKFKSEPAGLYAEATRDAFEIWAAAVEKAGCYDCYKEISDNIRASKYEGLCATYVFDPKDQSILQTDDTMPLVWFQIQDGKNVRMRPAKYDEGKPYRLPSWIK
ncbi:MAG: ABC transporter substrate-binding protein [Desulfobacula sp.]|jgi:branched-chain amino acid transport system substrate-binding protein|nr:ABC transporter substrate-binding protein [Desulfobacula sp.]MBT5546216.1 ABC transporter substrate-binding protein [Desulfobacula sp.]MBT7713047.1 ABC transporter substrate-binding protein [Deltaproteobacteria bacterium]